jgi:Zn-dependent peptidase ImmA (M78 family)
MKSSLSIMRKYLPSLNRRPITWRMIVRAARKLSAQVFCIPLKLDGYFVPAHLSLSGQPEIYVNSRLSEVRQIATAVHELAHTILHFALDRVLYSYRADWTVAARRTAERLVYYEQEACAFGAIALLPERKLRFASFGLFDPDDEFMHDIWRIRLQLRAMYGI